MAPKVFRYFLKKNTYHLDKTVSSGKSEDHNSEIHNANFETAISATKFGKFNVILFFMAVPAGWTSMFETTIMSYVFPAAQCDLDLSLHDKGSLNAITFFGMMTSGFFWGFLSDRLGRKKLLITGYFLDAIFVVLNAFSQNVTLVLIFKFLGGFVIIGPFAALAAYLSEFHCSKYRSRVQLVRGMIVSCGTVLLPLLAWAILPQKINIHLFDNTFVLHSWNIYILVCAIPSLLSGITFSFMPESPKFLMTVGRNAEALDIFKKVYSINTGRSTEEYPIKSLMDETKVDGYADLHQGNTNKNRIETVKDGFRQVKPLCFSPHLRNIILVCFIQTLYMLGKTLRLWLPQIFQSISDYKHFNNGTTASLCTMLQVLLPSKDTDNACHVNITSSVYINTGIIAVVSIFGYLITGILINKIGKKVLMGVFAVVGGLCALSIYFSQNSATVVALSSIYLSMISICGNILLTVVIDLFPTTLRTVTISLVMMLGRMASMVGNLIFPFLLTTGCAPPFFSIGLIFVGSSFLSMFLPNTELKALK